MAVMAAVEHHHPPTWLEALAWSSLGLAFACGLVILFDVFVRGHRQHMTIMDVVYPVTALYWSLVGLWFYLRYGRMNSKKVMMAQKERDEKPDAEKMKEADLRWPHIAKGDSHCGAGCTLGDIGAEWLVFMFGLTLFGKALFADYVLDFAFAWTLGVLFQYATIVPMRDVGRVKGIWAAIKADTLSIVAFQAGLFGGMALYQLVLFPNPLPHDTATYWMFMQLSMILGFFVAWPVNKWLIKAGWKEKM